ncbi:MULTISPECIES: F0F1 ATP synthase subunit epsilon [unclassified Rhizobium]|uniref:F0F1 ATP synthase subunit epsilon n=1 Tax=unclassified Rhizobium TaxID=2613769 RepID=UPI000713C995|nr:MULTISPECIES: F0F1 ATP synthase subunit epsilon [unclassified Rhizobium]KQS83932.1 ATP synthase F0F1 subunit epsilon [Rhizobium sp. Leaf386]KQT05036.1 ATP synthase F0F1 subunit epsilon [Rhizobium sp. Leaf391]KQU08872.1 ATP synthase F0F1 subunit epsilon [Rhizobium sp. Leaf453]
MADFNFELVSPERLLLSERVSEVVIPATEGEMTVMANHAPTMTTIKPGIVTVKAADGKVTRYVVFGGFADILPTGCTLLAESAVPVSELDRSAIDKRIEATKAELAEGSHGDEYKTRLEQFLAELTQLNGIVVAA